MLPLFQLVKNFFGFSRSQTNGFFVLIPLLMLILFSAPAYRWWTAQRKVDFSADARRADSLIALIEGLRPLEQAKHESLSLHRFDPNQATADELQSLGMDKVIATRIVHFRERGGSFKVKSDLLKIFGMDSSTYHALLPFIQLPEQRAARSSISKPAVVRFDSERTKVKFDLNSADTSQLKKIYGIGEKLSLRIIKYRDNLGGFISSEQLYEVWGLDSATVGRLMEVTFIETEFSPRKLSINTFREDEIAIHPYLSKSAAKAIAAYRFQHGRFQSIADLEKVQSLDRKTIYKIAPYLEFQD